ncbi:hypothetical protein A2U01_0038417 [Trifolium medium]|uniref:Uncharacterized protein n=1 Tax=Trifolium medium TaxID=97028 RepID=A0A392Q0M5_9FABA|nr:hypothetical protein [Trifolium medium]
MKYMREGKEMECEGCWAKRTRPIRLGVGKGNAVIIGREEGNLHLGGSNGMKEA